MSAEPYSEKDYEILDYIRNNPGTSKESVINAMTEKAIYSRATTWGRIKQFIQDGKVKAVKDRPNSQLYHLYLDQSNKANTILEELRDFRRAYFIFLNRVYREYRSHYPKLDYKKQSNAGNDVWELQENLNAMLQNSTAVYLEVIRVYFDKSLFEWPTEIRDKEELKKLYSNVYGQLAEMQTQLLSITQGKPLPSQFNGIEGHIYYNWLKEYGLHETFEDVLKSIKSWPLDEQLFMLEGLSFEDIKNGRFPKVFD